MIKAKGVHWCTSHQGFLKEGKPIRSTNSLKKKLGFLDTRWVYIWIHDYQSLVGALNQWPSLSFRSFPALSLVNSSIRYSYILYSRNTIMPSKVEDITQIYKSFPQCLSHVRGQFHYPSIIHYTVEYNTYRITKIVQYSSATGHALYFQIQTDGSYDRRSMKVFQNMARKRHIKNRFHITIMKWPSKTAINIPSCISWHV